MPELKLRIQSARSGSGHFDAVAIQLEERQHRDERQALVGVDERLALGDAVRQDGGLQRKIGIFVVGLATRPAESALKSALVPKLIGGLRGRAADDRRIQLQRISELEVDRLARAFLLVHFDLLWSALGARIVLGENLQGLWVLGDHALADRADPLAQLLGWHDPKLAAVKLLDEHGRARRVTACLELAGD